MHATLALEPWNSLSQYSPGEKRPGMLEEAYCSLRYWRGPPFAGLSSSWLLTFIKFKNLYWNWPYSLCHSKPIHAWTTSLSLEHVMAHVVLIILSDSCYYVSRQPLFSHNDFACYQVLFHSGQHSFFVLCQLVIFLCTGLVLKKSPLLAELS